MTSVGGRSVEAPFKQTERAQLTKARGSVEPVEVRIGSGVQPCRGRDDPAHACARSRRRRCDTGRYSGSHASVPPALKSNERSGAILTRRHEQDRDFTPEQDAELLRLNGAGVSIRMLARLRRETPSAVQRAIGRERKRIEQTEHEQKTAAADRRAAQAILHRPAPKPPPQATGRVGRIMSTDGFARVLDERDAWAEERQRRLERRGTGAGIVLTDAEFAEWRRQSPHAARDRRKDR